MSKIVNITALQILDSRGNPTIEVEITTKSGHKGVGLVPSGASTGKYEVLELRDKDISFFRGKGVQKAINNIIGPIKDCIVGYDVHDQQVIDNLLINLDSTENKSNLGANAILAVSLATLRAAADIENLPLYQYVSHKENYTLPIPLINIINGGAHADDSCDFQEFMIVPRKAESFTHAIRIAAEIFYSLRAILKNKGLSTNVGDEGGFAPKLQSNEQAIELLLQAIEEAKYKPGEQVFIAVDAAAAELYNAEEEVYVFKKQSEQRLTSKEMITLWQQWVSKYPIYSIEDALAEDDWSGWQKLTETIGSSVQIVGDDLFATNLSRLKKGITTSAANAILIKMNQTGTISETLEVVELARKHNWGTIISHRSGETEDTTIADLAVGLDLKQIKTGSICRSERTAKYNRLLRIEQQLGVQAIYSGLLLEK